MRAAVRLIARVSALALTLVSATLPRTADSQPARTDSHPDSLTLTLVVSDSADGPLAGADIILTSRSGVLRGRTDAVGRIRWIGLGAATYRAIVRQVGYEPASVDLPLERTTGVYALVLDAIAPPSLTTMHVVANASPAARYAAFEDRIRRGEPSASITRADIERRNPIQLSQLLRGLAGIRLADSLGNRVAVSTRGQKMSRSSTGNGLVPCVMRVSVDGVPLPALTNIDAMLPIDVYGIEVYNGPARMPTSMGGMRTDNWCGLIAIWTR